VAIQCEYTGQTGALTGDVELLVASDSDLTLTLQVTDHGYKSGDHTIVIEPRGNQFLVMTLGQSHQWYDFSVTIAGADRFLRRFAGRVETGKSGFSDPCLAIH
jgi:phospholipase C